MCGGVGKGASQLEQREHGRRRVPLGNRGGPGRAGKKEPRLWGEKVKSGARLELDGSWRGLNTETHPLTLPLPFFLSVWEAPVSPSISSKSSRFYADLP